MLSSVCEEVTSGGAAPQGDKYFINGKYPFVRVVDMGNLQGEKLMSQTRDLLNDNGTAKLRLFPNGTVLFTKSGASLLLNQRAILKKPMFVVSHIGCLIPNKAVISEWLYYWMKTVDFNIYAHATTLPSLKLTTIKELMIPVPPLPEQERIVARIEELFSQLDAGMETLKKTKAQLAVYRQAVLKEAFDSVEICFYLPLRTVILGSPQNGLYKPKDDYNDIGTPILRIDGFYDGFILDDYHYKRVTLSADEIERYALEIGDIVINRVNSMPYLGKCALVRSLGESTVFESNMMRIRLNADKIIGDWLSYYLSSYAGNKELTKNAKHAVNQASINQTDVGNALVPIPSLDDQKSLVSLIESRLSICDNIEQAVNTALKQAETMRQSILKEAFEGEL